MKIIQQIVEANGGLHEGLYLRVENPPWMTLVIEHIGVGPRGLPMLSVAHYYEQSGDAMRDPDVEAEIATDGLDGWRFLPVSYRQDGLGLLQTAVWQNDETGQVLLKPVLVEDLNGFLRTWNRNLSEQGFGKATVEVLG